MALRITEARKLCTKAELELVQQSSPTRIKGLTPARLRSKVERARKLRNKYRDLSRSQRRETRGKQDPRRSRPAQGNENTVRKKEIFQEVLERFEAALKKSEAATTTTAARKTGKKTSKKVAKKTTRKTTKKVGKKAAKKTGKKVGKKAGKKVGKKAGKKAAKKTARKVAAKKRPRRTGTASRTTARAGAASGAPVTGDQSDSAGITGETQVPGGHARNKSMVNQHETSKGRRKQKQFERMNVQRVQGHVGARTRRKQAKRDSA